MISLRIIVPYTLFGAMLVLGTSACGKKLGPEAQLAQDSSKTADSRVALLEQELATLKTVKPGDLDAEHVSKSHLKALEKQLADAKRQADTKQKVAKALAAQPVPRDVPKAVIVEVPANTKLDVKLAKDLSTESVQAGDAWEGSLAADVMVDGKVAWPMGTDVRGVISQSIPAGRLSSGNGGLGIKLTYIGNCDVESGVHLVSGTPRGERNAKYIGGAAALGALVGILTDKHNKNDHALGGAAIGAAAGTAVAAGTADTVIRMPAAKVVTFTLSAPERVTLKF